MCRRSTACRAGALGRGRLAVGLAWLVLAAAAPPSHGQGDVTVSRNNVPAAVDSTMLARIRALATDARVAAAIDLLRERDDEITELQIRFARIPAPDYRAPQRAALLLDLLRAAGLEGVHQDAAGNVLARLHGTAPAESAVVLSAHLDTVFPGLDSILVEREGTILRGPGVADDAAGLAAMVHLARALRDARVPLRRDIVIAGTVGEEGEGDLRGVKHLFEVEVPPARVAAFLTLDLGSPTQFANGGLGSRRLHVTVRGPGGHSWADFGRPNPIHALSRAVAAFVEAPLPLGPRCSFNVGVIEGGRGVNVIPEEASLRLDLRCESAEQLSQLEESFRAALDQALERERAWSAGKGDLAAEIDVIGDRPVGITPPESPLVTTAVAAFASRSFPVFLGSSSTDANLPMSLGVPALGLPHGCQGHEAHSLREWCDTAGRPAVLGAELLTLVALAELAGPVQPSASEGSR